MGPSAAKLKPLGDIFLNLMCTIVVPLVFFSISSAVANTKDSKRLGKIFGVMIVLFVLTSTIAALLMVVAVKLYPPALGVTLQLSQMEGVKNIKAVDQIVKALTVADFYEVLSKRNMLALIVMAILTGLATSSAGKKAEQFLALLNGGAHVMMKIVGYIMYYAPIGLGAYFAYLVGVFGPDLLGTYVRSMLIYYPLAIAYFFIAFTFYVSLAGGTSAIKTFWKNITGPTVTSLATSSSMATIPSNLEAAAKSGVSEDIREVVIPIGATIHMEGSCLASILKIALLFGLFGMNFSGFENIATAVGIAVLSGSIMSGIPSGGFLGELLIVVTYGFPMEAMPIISMIGTLVDPPATMLNAVGDNVVSMIVTRVIDKKNVWN